MTVDSETTLSASGELPRAQPSERVGATPKPPMMRLAGIVVACSAPISGFLTYALSAIIFGESRLEGPDTLTATGYVAFGLPLIAGVALVLFSLWKPWTPSRPVVAVACAVAAAVLLTFGVWSVVSSGETGDASIGGGLVALASMPAGTAAIVLWVSHRADSD